MEKRLILFDVIPWFVGWPLSPAWTALLLVVCLRKYDGQDGFYVHFDGLEGHPPHFTPEPAEPRLFVVELRGHETSGRGFGSRYRVSEYCDEVEQTLGGVGDAEDVSEEFQAEYDEMAFGNILGFGGYETRDWGYLAWESERGPDEFMTMKRS